MTCPRCNDLGAIIDPSLQTYQHQPCPACRPYIIEKEGGSRLVLQTRKWGTFLAVGKGAGSIAIGLSPAEMLALASALVAHARKAK